MHQMIWFQSGKSSFYFWNQFRILVYHPLGNWNRPQIW